MKTAGKLWLAVLGLSLPLAARAAVGSDWCPKRHVVDAGLNIYRCSFAAQDCWYQNATQIACAKN
ncbi:hypothetical protein HNR42_002205 [Deinobacterium chartae]|uniref:Uncharacterized protein n=1 Tax=Deinobacterium chartae TaxID=521158 RepID=A0A841I2Y1_9DEIO|nr:hypothetical protein [Deinobacterium chartae]